MSKNDRLLREVLEKLAEYLARGTSSGGDDSHEDDEGVLPNELLGCTPKVVPRRLLEKAAEIARRVNPINAPAFGPLAAAGLGDIDPMSVAVVTQKYWGAQPRVLSVSFMDGGSNELKNRILKHMNAWNCGVSFALTNGVGKIRITRAGGGFSSYVGTDNLLRPASVHTMTLQNFTMNTPESEYKRVVQHEAGHALGFTHEQLRPEFVKRIDEQKAIAFFARTSGWPAATTRSQVLTPVAESTLVGTPVDQDSIMCYQIPGSITKDGIPIRGGKQINATDAAFAAAIYPKAGSALAAAPAASYGAVDDDSDWPESLGVADPDLSF